jgi:hypothetical protein
LEHLGAARAGLILRMALGGDTGKTILYAI